MHLKPHEPKYECMHAPDEPRDGRLASDVRVDLALAPVAHVVPGITLRRVREHEDQEEHDIHDGFRHVRRRAEQLEDDVGHRDLG